MIKHSLEAHSMMPDMHLRFNIYTDPRTPVQVKPGIYKVGNPGAESPVFLTTNFALTYYTVESDIASNGIDATSSPSIPMESACRRLWLAAS